MRIPRTLAAAGAATFLAGTVLGVSGPSSAAPVVTGGLVNVTVTDVDVLNDSLNDLQVRVLNNALNDNAVNVGVAAQVIALVCDTQVGVLADLRNTGDATCDAGSSTITFQQVAS